MAKEKLTGKQLLIVIGVPATVVMIIILCYAFFKKIDNRDSLKDNKSKSSALVLPDVKDDTSKKSKSSLYDDLTEKEREKNQQKNLQSSKDFFDMNEKTTPNNEDKQESSALPPSGTGNNVSYTNNNTSGKKYTGGSASQYYQSSAPAQNTASNNPVVQQTSKDDNSYNNGYSFGVYKNPSATVKSSGDASSAVQQNDYIPAILENSQNIKPGTEVIFLLQQDSYISGQDYEKMAIMYGIASFNGGRMDITINTIQDKTGQKHPVNLIGYNENYQKGVYYSDADANIKQGKSNVFSSTANGVATTLIGGGAAGSVVNGVVQTTQGSLNNSKAEVDVSQGYKMYFK